MKNDRIAIICNGVVPGSSIPSGAHGLRVRGLQLGLQALGQDVDIISFSRKVRHQIKHWGAKNARIPSYWRILDAEKANRLINQDYRTVIIPNWAVMPDFRPQKKVRLIYDFFSATQVEHTFLTDAETLLSRREQKLEILRCASGFIGNGIGRAEYGKAFLLENGLGDQNVTSVRLAVLGAPREIDHNAPFRIFSGGFDQPWTEGLGIEDLERIAAKTGADICTIGVGKNMHANDDANMLRKLTQTESADGRILGYPPASVKKYNALNSRCHVALDVFKNNVERKVSYSTRAVSALSNNCPLITMSFTEIGQIVKELECGWVLDDLSIEALVTLIQDIKNNPKELERRAMNTKLFQERFGDPVVEAKGLAELLR